MIGTTSAQTYTSGSFARSTTYASTRRSQFEIFDSVVASNPVPEVGPARGAPERMTRGRDRVVARLRALARYSAGWDGEQAQAPLRAAIKDAINFVANIGIDPPFSPALEPDGSVDLVLELSSGWLVFVFEGDGKAQMYVRGAGSDVVHAEFAIPMFIGNGVQVEEKLQHFGQAA